MCDVPSTDGLSFYDPGTDGPGFYVPSTDRPSIVDAALIARLSSVIKEQLTYRDHPYYAITVKDHSIGIEV